MGNTRLFRIWMPPSMQGRRSYSHQVLPFFQEIKVVSIHTRYCSSLFTLKNPDLDDLFIFIFTIQQCYTKWTPDALRTLRCSNKPRHDHAHAVVKLHQQDNNPATLSPLAATQVCMPNSRHLWPGCFCVSAYACAQYVVPASKSNNLPDAVCTAMSQWIHQYWWPCRRLCMRAWY